MLNYKEKSSVETLTDQAYFRLRGDIISGELAPNTKLAIDALREKLGLGASPIREALSRLAGDGLVTLVGQRGFRVKPMSIEDLEDVTRLRILLETEALRESFDNSTDEWEAQLIAAHHKLSKLKGKEGTMRVEWEAANFRFHEALVAQCHSPRLRKFRNDLFDEHRRYRSISIGFSVRAGDVALEHSELLDAALARDITRAEELIRHHIQLTADTLIGVLNDRHVD